MGRHCGAAHWAAPAYQAGRQVSGAIQAAQVGRRGPLGRPTMSMLDQLPTMSIWIGLRSPTVMLKRLSPRRTPSLTLTLKTPGNWRSSDVVRITAPPPESTATVG